MKDYTYEEYMVKTPIKQIQKQANFITALNALVSYAGNKTEMKTRDHLSIDDNDCSIPGYYDALSIVNWQMMSFVTEHDGDVLDGLRLIKILIEKFEEELKNE